MHNLNSFIDATSMLQELGIKVNQIPDITTCPACEAMEFYAGRDPAGGGWFSCNHCHWAGDSLELAAYVRGKPLETILNELMDKDTKNTITRERIGEYLSYQQRRKSAGDYWLEASDRDKIRDTRSDSAKQLLRAYRLPDLLSRSTWDTGMGKYVGLASKELYTTFLEPESAHNTLPGRSGKQTLVSPMFDAPGRIAAVASFDIGQGRKRFRCTPIPYGTADSLLFMNNVYMHDEVIYAMSELSFALALQIWAHESLVNGLPLLGYTAETDTAWLNVRPQKLIFWDREINDELFVAARKMHDRAYIADKPKAEGSYDPFHCLQGFAAQHFLGCMRESAKPWLQVLKDYLLTNGAGSSHGLISRLGLTPGLREELLSYCQTPEERQQLSKMIDIGVIEMRFSTGVKGQHLIQRSGGWYLQSGGASDAAIMTNAIPVIETFTNFDLHTIYTGHIRAGDKNIPFEIDSSEFSADWVEKYCRRSGNIHVSINSRIRRDLEHLATTFHQPVNRDGLDTIGWDGNNFLFPRFTIRADGQAVEQKRPIAGQHPMQQLNLVTTLTIAQARGWVEDTPAHALYWALVASLLTNVIAPAINKETRGIGLVSRVSDNREDILQGIVEDMALETYRVKAGQERETIKAIVATEHNHNIPLHVEFYGSPLALQWMQDVNNRNAVTVLKPGVVRAALLRGGWTIIDYKDRLDEALSIPHGYAIMPSLLIMLMKNGGKLPSTKGHTTFGVFALIRNWLKSRFGIERAPVLDKAEALVNTGTPDGIAGAGSRFIGTLLYLLEEGSITIKESDDLVELPGDKAAVVNTKDHIYLNFHAIKKAFDKAKIYMPEVSELSQSFFESGLLQEEKYGLHSINGWYLDVEKWGDEVRRWSEL